MKQLFLLIFLTTSQHLIGQSDGISIGITSPHESSVLHIQPESNNKGLLIPRLTSNERLNIAPSTDANGLMVYDTDQESLYHFDGSTWHQVGSPKGTIVMWSGTAIPQGWALCNGNWYNPNDNNDSGGTQTTERSVPTPNLSGRFVVGYNPGITDYNQPGNISSGGTTSGNMDGDASVVLQTEEMPRHRHTVNNSGAHIHTGTASGGSHSHTVSWSRGSPQEDTPSNEPDRGGGGNAARDGLPTELTINNSGAHSHTINVNATNSAHTHTMEFEGNGEPHENRPPYYVLAYIMKL